MYLEVPPHVPSGETTPEGVEPWVLLVRVLEETLVDVERTLLDADEVRVELLEARVDVRETLLEDEDEEMPHFPKRGWQFVPQCPAVLPQKLYSEQHSPPEKPMQVYPEVPPQVASGEVMVAVVVGAEEVREEVREDVREVVCVAGREKEDVVATLPLVAALYQLASGSPKHLPIVTPV